MYYRAGGSTRFAQVVKEKKGGFLFAVPGSHTLYQSVLLSALVLGENRPVPQHAGMFVILLIRVSTSTPKEK